MVHPVPEGGLVLAYIISGADGLMVIDPGSVGTAEAVMTVIRRMCGRSMAGVRGIVATHFHFDHIGGIGRVLRECPTGPPAASTPSARTRLRLKRRSVSFAGASVHG